MKTRKITKCTEKKIVKEDKKLKENKYYEIKESMRKDRTRKEPNAKSPDQCNVTHWTHSTPQMTGQGTWRD